MTTILAQVADSTAVASNTPAGKSLLEYFFAGGALMYVLLALSIIAIYIFGKKWWMIHKASKTDKLFMQDIRDYIHEGKIQSATELCAKFDTPEARLVEKGLERLGRPLTDIQTAVENTANAEIARLEKGLPYLATISGGAPMIGFLGTVIGMVGAFGDLSAKAEAAMATGATEGINNIMTLSGDINVAMITTVGGLIVGLIAFFGYNYLTAQITNLVSKLENTSIEFMDILHEPAGE